MKPYKVLVQSRAHCISTRPTNADIRRKIKFASCTITPSYTRVQGSANALTGAERSDRRRRRVACASVNTRKRTQYSNRVQQATRRSAARKVRSGVG